MCSVLEVCWLVTINKPTEGASVIMECLSCHSGSTITTLPHNLLNIPSKEVSKRPGSWGVDRD